MTDALIDLLPATSPQSPAPRARSTLRPRALSREPAPSPPAAIDVKKSEGAKKSEGGSKWEVIKATLRFTDPNDSASFRMMKLYKANLDVRVSAIDLTSLSERQKESYKSVEALLSNSTDDLEWDDIYKAESMIALLYSGEQLREEIDANLEDFTQDDKVEGAAFKQRYQLHHDDIKNVDDASLRLFSLRLLEAFHINLKRKYLARPIRLQATNRILKCLLFAFCLLILPYVLLVVDDKDNPTRYWSLFPLYTALTAGLLGAFSSRLNGIQRQWANMNLDEVFLQREWSYTFLRAGVGVCGAIIVYIFLRSGIASGAIFPDFNLIKIDLIVVDTKGLNSMAFAIPSKDLALLTFWSFLAGFSETLVGNVLKSSEQQLTEAASQTQKPVEPVADGRSTR
jgi:hypothetical protein